MEAFIGIMPLPWAGINIAKLKSYALRPAGYFTSATKTFSPIRLARTTLKIFKGKKPARGLYDLVIINDESYKNPEVQNMKSQASWNDYLHEYARQREAVSAALTGRDE